jgi:hypothetical protein
MFCSDDSGTPATPASAKNAALVAGILNDEGAKVREFLDTMSQSLTDATLDALARWAIRGYGIRALPRVTFTQWLHNTPETSAVIFLLGVLAVEDRCPPQAWSRRMYEEFLETTEAWRHDSDLLLDAFRQAWAAYDRDLPESDGTEQVMVQFAARRTWPDGFQETMHPTDRSHAERQASVIRTQGLAGSVVARTVVQCPWISVDDCGTE